MKEENKRKIEKLIKVGLGGTLLSIAIKVVLKFIGGNISIYVGALVMLIPLISYFIIVKVFFEAKKFCNPPKALIITGPALFILLIIIGKIVPMLLGVPDFGNPVTETARELDLLTAEYNALPIVNLLGTIMMAVEIIIDMLYIGIIYNIGTKITKSE